MNVDDEYDEFFDELDEATLASLAEIEQQNASNTTEERPAKRKKLHHEPEPDNTTFDLDELPEISVQNNFYSAGIGVEQVLQERPQQQQSQAYTNNIPNGRIGVASSSRTTLPTRNSWNPPRQSSQSSTPARQNERSKSHNSYQPRRGGMSRASSNTRLSIIANALASASEQPPPPTPPQQPPPPAHAHAPVAHPQDSRIEPDSEAVAQIAELKRKLEEVYQQNSAIQAQLKEAQEARYTSVGEVTILRGKLEKNAKEYAGEIAKFRAEKEQTASKQLDEQKNLKAEMERLKTQLAFKQQEADSSILTFRKAPPSARKKTGLPLQSTSTHSQSPLTTRQAASIMNLGLENLPSATPMRARTVARLPRSPETSRKSEPSLGFVNSFLEPARTSKLKPPPHPVQPLPPTSTFAPSQPMREHFDPPHPSFPQDFLMEDAPALDSDPAQPMDQEMAEESSEDDDDSAFSEPIPQFRPHAELNRIVLTHSHPASSKSPTLQFLVEAATPYVETNSLFSSSIASILEALSSSTSDLGYEYSIATLTRCLLALCGAFGNANLLSPLTAILNLLTILICSFPQFRHSLLSYETSKVIDLLSEIIITHLKPDSAHDTLSDEVFTLVEMLVLDVPEDALVRVASFPCNVKLFMVLFDTSQSAKFLSRSARLLALLFSYPKMYENCVAAQTGTNEDGSPLEFQRAFNLSRLCSILIDVDRHDKDSIEMKIHILSFFSSLSIAHADALKLLASSNILVPSLVSYIAYLARPIWEEEDEDSFLPQFKPASDTIRTLNKTVALLHHIVFTPTLVVNLSDKIQRVPARAFNGLNHCFVVAFGRISYADPPDWLQDEDKLVMAGMVEIATELLELVVTGPEGEGICATHRDEAEHSMMMSEDEMEG